MMLAKSSQSEGAYRGSQQIAALFDKIGKQEQVRQQRQQLDRISSLVAKSQSEGTSPSLNEILGAINQPAQFDSGLGGIFQNIGDRFKPQGGGFGDQIKGGIVSDALQRAMQPAGSTQIPAGLEPSSVRTDEAGKITGRSYSRPLKESAKTPTAIKREQKEATDKDIKILTSTKTEYQKIKARERIDADESRILQPSTSGDEDFEKILNDKDKVGGKYGEKAYKNALNSTKDLARSLGEDPAQAEQRFNEWWDERVQIERTGFTQWKKNVTIPRDEMKAGSMSGRTEPEAIIPELPAEQDPNSIDSLRSEVGKLSDEELQRILDGS